MQKRFIVALTGASGAIYAQRLLSKLADAGHKIDLVISEAGCVSFGAETGIHLSAARLDAEKLLPGRTENVTVHGPREIGATIASGSVRHDGMVIVPCSMGTLARVANGFADSLITRAADVTLKERRKLLLVTRELPLSLIHLRNMTLATEAGATVFHACPHFYNRPQTVEEVADTVVDRVLDHLGVDVQTARWKEAR
ncbi:UbiX family flavin prenyltransferase [bacterium]|nr:MAG: UbiX family flavin prenyltransferase [bacterium]